MRLGLGLYFEAGEGPKFHKTVRTEQDVLIYLNLMPSLI